MKIVCTRIRWLFIAVVHSETEWQRHSNAECKQSRQHSRRKSHTITRANIKLVVWCQRQSLHNLYKRKYAWFLRWIFLVEFVVVLDVRETSGLTSITSRPRYFLFAKITWNLFYQRQDTHSWQLKWFLLSVVESLTKCNWQFAVNICAYANTFIKLASK